MDGSSANNNNNNSNIGRRECLRNASSRNDTALGREGGASDDGPNGGGQGQGQGEGEREREDRNNAAITRARSQQQHAYQAQTQTQAQANNHTQTRPRRPRSYTPCIIFLLIISILIVAFLGIMIQRVRVGYSPDSSDSNNNLRPKSLYPHSDLVGFVLTVYFTALMLIALVRAAIVDPGKVPRVAPWDPDSIIAAHNSTAHDLHLKDHAQYAQHNHYNAVNSRSVGSLEKSLENPQEEVFSTTQMNDIEANTNGSEKEEGRDGGVKVGEEQEADSDKADDSERRRMNDHVKPRGTPIQYGSQVNSRMARRTGTPNPSPLASTGRDRGRPPPPTLDTRQGFKERNEADSELDTTEAELDAQLEAQRPLLLSHRERSDGTGATGSHRNDDALPFTPISPLLNTAERKRDGGARFCQVCRVYKPDRCHHCSGSRACILELDHYCPWIHNSIGYFNKKYFLLMVLYGWMALVAFCVTLAPVFVDSLKVQSVVDFLAVICWLLAAILGLCLTGFLGMHIWMAARGYTTIEVCEKRHAEPNRYTRRGEPVKDLYRFSPYDLGVYRNLQHFLGPNILLWFFPTRYGMPKGSKAGASFELNRNHPLYHMVEEERRRLFTASPVSASASDSSLSSSFGKSNKALDNV